MNDFCVLNNSVTSKILISKVSYSYIHNLCFKCYYYPCMATTELPCKLNKTAELNCLNNFGIDNDTYNIKSCVNVALAYVYNTYKTIKSQSITGACIIHKLYDNPENIDKLPDITTTTSFTQTNTITPTNTVYITNQVLQSTPHFRFDNVTETETATINTTKTFTETKTQNVTETQTQTKVCPNVTTKTPVLVTLPKSTFDVTKDITTTQTNNITETQTQTNNICPTSTKYIQENTKNIDNIVRNLSDLDFQKCLNNNQTIGLVETTEIAKNIEQSFIDKIGLTYVIIGASFISTLLLFAIILCAKRCIKMHSET